MGIQFLNDDSGLSNRQVLELMITAVALADVLDGDGSSLGSKMWLAYMGANTAYDNIPDVRTAFDKVKEKAQTFVGARLNLMPKPF
jgi:hypothetical protein